MGKHTKKIDVDAGYMFIGGIEALPDGLFDKLLPRLEEDSDDVMAVDVAPADSLRMLVVRTISGPGLSGTHAVRIIRDKAGRAVQAVIDLVSDGVERG